MGEVHDEYNGSTPVCMMLVPSFTNLGLVSALPVHNIILKQNVSDNGDFSFLDKNKYFGWDGGGSTERRRSCSELLES